MESYDKLVIEVEIPEFNANSIQEAADEFLDGDVLSMPDGRALHGTDGAPLTRREEGVLFTVAGVPAPQGSKTRTKWGVREDNPATKPWRAAVAWEATAAMQGLALFTGPVLLAVTFRFPRPKSHYRTGKNAADLKPSAPMFHATKPDTDKLLRAIGDAITGIVVRDDSQIVQVVAAKLYGTPHAEVHIVPLGAAA